MNLIIIDGNNALYRYGHAYSTLATSDGVPTGAVYGLLVCLLRLKKKYPESRFVMVWDGPGKSWRHEFWPEYKAARQKKDKSDVAFIFKQLPTLKKLTTMVGIPSVQLDGVEADDLIGILAFSALKAGHSPFIFSTDKDFIQLMSHGIGVVRDVSRGEENQESVHKLFKCRVQIKDVLKLRAICGDKSDGIPGVIRGLGPVGALKLIEAGYDPAVGNLEFTTAHKICGVWADVHRNYRLMKVHLRTRALTDEQRIALSFQWGGALLEPDGVKKGMFREFVQALADLELEQAIEDRLLLWKLQDIIVGVSGRLTTGKGSKTL